MNKCISCGQNISLLGKKNDYLIYRCPACGLGLTDNTQIQQGNYHRDDIYIKESAQFTNIFQRRVRLLEEYKKVGKVLEIGSSGGLLLSLLQKKGWEVMGIEISHLAAEFAQRQGIFTMEIPFEKAKIAPGTFDAVVINQTLEHMKDPILVIEKISRVLKKDGVVLVDVPNFGSLSARFWGANWQYLLPKEHHWHFTYPALKNLLRKANLEVISKSTPSGIWDYGNPFGEIFQAFTSFKKRFLTDIFTAITALIITLLGLGTSLTVVARKN